MQLAGFAAKLDDLPPRLRHGFVDPFIRAGARPSEFGDLPVEPGQVLAERFDEVVHRAPPRFEVLGGEFALALEAFVRLGAFLPEAVLRLLAELVVAGLQRGQCGTLEAFFQRLADGFQLPGACFVRFLEPCGFGAGFRELRLELRRGLAGFPPFAGAIFFHRGDALVALLNRRLGTGQRVVPPSHVVAQSVAFARDFLDGGVARRGVAGPPDEAPDGDEEPRTQQGEDDEGDFHTRMSGSGGGVKMPGRDYAAVRPFTPGSRPQPALTFSRWSLSVRCPEFVERSKDWEVEGPGIGCEGRSNIGIRFDPSTGSGTAGSTN